MDGPKLVDLIIPYRPYTRPAVEHYTMALYWQYKAWTTRALLSDSYVGVRNIY